MTGRFEVFVILWTILACAVIALAIYRRWVARTEDDTLHVLEDAVVAVPRQTAFAQRMDAIDRWGKLLTIFTVVSGLVLAGVYLYNAWQASLRTTWAP
jgi:hypothetical protein